MNPSETGDPRIRSWLASGAPRTSPRSILARAMSQLDQDPRQERALAWSVGAAFPSVIATTMVIVGVVAVLLLARQPERDVPPGQASASPQATASPALAPSSWAVGTYRFTDPVGGSNPDIKAVTAEVTNDGRLIIGIELVTDWPAADTWPFDGPWPLLGYIVPDLATYQHEVFNGVPKPGGCDPYFTGYGFEMDRQGAILLTHHEHTAAVDNGPSFKMPLAVRLLNGKTLSFTIPLARLGTPGDLGFAVQLGRLGAGPGDRFPDVAESCQSVVVRVVAAAPSP